MLSTVIKVSSKRYVDNMSTQCTTHLVVDSHAEPLQSTLLTIVVKELIFRLE